MPELLSAKRVIATRERAESGVRTVASAEPAAVAAEYVGDGWGARWLGTEGALARFGLPTEGAREVDAEALERALRGQTVAEDHVRKPRHLRLEPDRRSEQVIGLAHTEFYIEAPAAVNRLWERSSAAERAEIEAVLMEAAGAAVDHVVSADEVVRIGTGKTFAPAVGFAAAATLDRSPPEQEGEPTTLAVRAIVVGVQREDGTVVAITGPDAAREQTLEEAQFAGLETISRGLTERGFGVNQETRELEAGVNLGAAQAALRAAEAAAPRVLGRDDVTIEDPLDAYDRRLGPARHGISARANELADFVANQVRGQGRTWLEDRYAEGATAIRAFDGRAAVDVERYQDQRARLEERAAELEEGDPRLDAMQARWDELSEQERQLGERHRDVFLQDHSETLARLVAVEREWRTLDEVEIANRQVQALAAPAAEHEHALGPAPDVAAPDRPGWEELVGRMERERFYYEREAEQDAPGRPRPIHLERDSARRQLEDDITQLRVERGLDQPAAAVEVGVEV